MLGGDKMLIRISKFRLLSLGPRFSRALCAIDWYDVTIFFIKILRPDKSEKEFNLQ